MDAQPVNGSVDPGLSAVLGVFRRPQTKADGLPAGVTHDGLLEAPFFATYDANLVRLAYTSPAGDRFYVIPGTTAPPPLLLSCSPPLTASQRQEKENAYARFHPTTQILVLRTFASGHGSEGGVGPIDAKTVLAGLAVSGDFGRGEGVIYGFVPDGVASVSIITRASRRPTTAHVANNMFFIFEPPNGTGAVTGAKTITWSNTAGRPIKTIDDDPCLLVQRGATQLSCGHPSGKRPAP